MKTLEQIAEDCGADVDLLRDVMEDAFQTEGALEEELCETIGALYRRIEKLEEEKNLLVDALVVVRDADCDEDGMNGEYALPLDIERRVKGALRFAGALAKEEK